MQPIAGRCDDLPMNFLVGRLIAIAIITVAFVPPYLDASQQAYIPERYRGIILNAPEPDFPASTTNTMSGQGVYRLIINPKTGMADEVQVLMTTGYRKFDAVAVLAFMQWKFRPGALKQIDIPVYFERVTGTNKESQQPKQSKF